MFPKFLKPIEAHSVHELGLGAIFAIFFWPAALLVYCVNVTLRFISQKLCNLQYPGRYVIADGEDSVFGVKLPGSSKSYIYGYQIIKGIPNINLIRSKMLEIFQKTDGYDRLKYMMVPKNGYFFWDTKIPFDITKHIRLLDNFDVNEIIDEVKLTNICSYMVGSEVGNGDMPQWEILMIPKYRTSDQREDSARTSHYALIIRMHHAYCDGISFVLLLNNFLADKPGELPIDPRKGFDNPIWIKIYIWAKLFIIGPFNFFKNLTVLVLSKSEYRVPYYKSPKVLARSTQVEMDTLREIRLASGTSVTAITISAVFEALYKTHLKIFPGKPIPQKFHLGSIGVMLPYAEEKHLVNQFTMWRFTALLKMDDPKERLEKTFEEIRRSASQPDPVFNYFMQRALGSLPKFLHEILFNLSGTPAMLSNVPGFKTPVKVFGGEIVDVAAWIPLVTTTGIGLSSQSYSGKMNFSAIVDPQIFPNAAEAKLFLDEIVHQIRILADVYGIQPQTTMVHTHVQNVAESIVTCEGQPRNDRYEPSLKNEIKDANHNDESEVVNLRCAPNSQETIPTILVSASGQNQTCRHRIDNLKLENENVRNKAIGSFTMQVEKVIY